MNDLGSKAPGRPIHPSRASQPGPQSITNLHWLKHPAIWSGNALLDDITTTIAIVSGTGIVAVVVRIAAVVVVVVIITVSPVGEARSKRRGCKRESPVVPEAGSKVAATEGVAGKSA